MITLQVCDFSLSAGTFLCRLVTVWEDTWAGPTVASSQEPARKPAPLPNNPKGVEYLQLPRK